MRLPQPVAAQRRRAICAVGRHGGAAWLARVIIAAALLLSSTGTGRASAEPSIAFYYGSFAGIDAPWELAVAYDRLVVEPGHRIDPRSLAARGTEPFAYVSVGEVADGAVDRERIDEAWALGRNPDWQSTILDVSHPGYRDYLVAKVRALLVAGYAGVFLDTLDSYVRVAKEPAQRERLRRGLAQIVQQLALQAPQAKILLNRGFEILPEVGTMVHGVVAESLFDRYEAGSDRYTRVPPEDFEWLSGKLRDARDRYHLPVTVIDYRAPADRVAARQTAKKIAELGFVPYVADGGLQTAGVGAADFVPRRVLLVSLAQAELAQRSGPLRAGGTAQRAEDLPVGYRLLAPVLEQLGAVVEHLSPEGALPERPLAGTYAGVVSLLPADYHSARYGDFLRRQMQAGVPLVVFGGPGVDEDSEAYGALGLQVQDGFREGGGGVRIVERSPLVGFEAEPPAGRFASSHGIRTDAVRRPHLVLADGGGKRRTVVATTLAGGAALSHYTTLVGPHGHPAWVIDPFTFIQKSLRLPALPRLVVHTAYGQRVGLVVVRGTGAERRSFLPGRPPAFQVVKSRLMNRYGLLHSVTTWSATGESVLGREADRVAALGRLPNGRSCVAEAALSSAPYPHRLLWTQLQPMAYPVGDELAVPVPVASDLSYIEQSVESYPLVAVEQSWASTGAPRRLAPAALDYHAFAVASPGGLSALEHLHRALEDLEVHPQYFDDYRAQVQAFRKTVLLRQGNGYALRNGARAQTLAWPVELGDIDWERSRGILTFTEDNAERYATVQGGRNGQLVLAASGAAVKPHVASANVQLLDAHVAAGSSVELDLHWQAHVGPRLRFAGLPPFAHCELRTHKLIKRGRSSQDGAWELNWNETGEGAGKLTCVQGTGD